MELLEEIKTRSSAKSFTGESLPKETLERILEAGRLAPSAKNRQPWRFVTITSSSKKESIQTACYGDPRVTQAGAVISICTTNIDYKMPNGQLSYPVDLSFAASFMLLQAEHEHLGSAVLTTFKEQEIIDLLSVPYGMKVVLLLLVGVKKTDSHAYRLPIERIASYEHW